MTREDAISEVKPQWSRVHHEFCLPRDNCRCDEEAIEALMALGVPEEEARAE